MSDIAPLSARNPKISQLRRLLGRRSARHEAGGFVVEGPTLVRDALLAGLDVDEVFIDEALVADVDDPRSTEVLAEAERRGVRRTVVARGVLERVGSTVTPQPTMAVVGTCALALDAAIGRAGGRLVLLLAGVADPGNAGTLLRSAEASGVGAVVFAGDAVDPFNPKVVRASAGSLFRVPLAIGQSVPDVRGALAAGRYSILGTAARGGTAYDHCDLTTPVAVALGNEARGLPDDLDVDDVLTIPIAGEAESLNVAMAGTLICFEAARQRRG